MSASHGCERCGDPGHCACYHDACCTCGSKEHGSCGAHPAVNRAVEHGDNCVTCTDAPQLATGGAVTRGWPVIGEEGCTLYVPVRVPDRHVTLEFDTSDGTLQRIRDALRRQPGQP
jgi:hypothetical protein